MDDHDNDDDNENDNGNDNNNNDRNNKSCNKQQLQHGDNSIEENNTSNKCNEATIAATT